MLSRILRLGLCLPTLLAILSLWSAQANATPAFAKKEMKECNYCHVNPGGPRNFRGLYYKAHGNSFADFDNIYEAARRCLRRQRDGAGRRSPPSPSYPNVKVPDVLKFTVKDIDGKPVNLARYRARSS